MPPLSPVHTLHQASRLYLYVRYVDMRRSFDGLHALVQSELHRDVHNGDVFLFVNKNRDRIKILRWISAHQHQTAYGAGVRLRCGLGARRVCWIVLAS
jgi:hypothetical protein